MDFTIKEISTAEVTLKSPIDKMVIERVISESPCDSVEINIMFTLIIIIMIEEGFILLNEENEVIDIIKIDLPLLKKWQSSSGALQLNLVMCGFNDIPLKLLISPLGATVLVNLVIKELNAETYTTCLTLGSYVFTSRFTSPITYHICTNQLATALKDKVTSAVKSRILSYHGSASASLIGLPEEVLFNIVMYLPIKDINNVSKTCKRLNFVLNKEILWHALLKRDFGVDQCTNDLWKMTYKRKYTEEEDNKLRQAHRHAGSMHDHMDYSDFISYIDNPMWDFM